MRKIKSIQIKAAFLLIAFSLNSIIGFSCAVGMGMCFNSHHHEEAVSKSSHHSVVNPQCDECAMDQHQSKNSDNCCHNKTSKIAQVDKVVPDAFSISVNFLSLTAIASAFYELDYSDALANSQIKYFVRSHHPPIPDIRIAIRSFQI